MYVINVSQSVSNDDNNPVEEVTECTSTFLGSFFCNTVLQLESRKSGEDVSERILDNIESGEWRVESEYDLDKKCVADRHIKLLSKGEGRKNEGNLNKKKS